MKTYKTRHQLFLTEELSRRLEQRARSMGKARSDILVEALQAWFEQRAAAPVLEEASLKMTQLERKQDMILRRQGLLLEAVARLLRSHLRTSSSLPPPSDAHRIAAARMFETFMNEMVDRLEGKEPPPPDDPVIARLRKLH